MDFIADGFIQALKLIFSGDREAFEILMVTLKVSLISATLAAIIGIPAGFAIGISEYRGKSVALALLNTAMSIPTVTIGLVVFAFLSRRGPLGSMGLLFTQTAIIIGEVLLALPIVMALSCAAVKDVDGAVRKTARTLGAGRFASALAVLGETRYALLAAVVAGYGRVVAEVGSAMMLGGNIKGSTRTLTTAIAFETGKGEFAFSFALGILLLLLALAVTGVFHIFHKRV